MIGPRHMGSSPTLKRQLSRLSSSSSFQVRQSNSRIYTFLVAGGLLLLATVALLQVFLLRAPQGSKLSPLENGKSDDGIVPEQSWWSENDMDLDLANGKERAVEKSKLGRKMGAVEVVNGDEVEESTDEGMDVGDEMEDDGDEDEDSDQQTLFDIDVDDRMLDEEAEDEDPDLAVLAEMSNDEDSAENPSNEAVGKSRQKVSDILVSAVSAGKQGGKRVDSAKLIGVGLVSNKKGSSNPADHDGEKLVRHESKQGDKMVEVNAIPDWVLDIELSSQQEGIVGTLQGFERDLVKGLEKKKGSFFWDHALGIRKRSLENVEPLSAEETKDDAAVVKSGGNLDKQHVTTGDGGAAKVAMQHFKGFKDFVESWKERFNSDDELIDDNVQQRLEGVREIEDALLLNGDGAADRSTSSKKFGALLKKGPRGSFDRMNPTSNPMLQDPDTPPGTWMTKTDKEMLRAIRGDRSSDGQQKALLRGNILDVVTVADSVERRQASAR